MRGMILNLLSVMICFFSTDCQTKKPMAIQPNIIANIRANLPAGWECTVIEEVGKMGHPHGLDEPLFRVDFVNPNLAFDFQWNKNETKRINAEIQLFFYHISSKAHIVQVVDKENVYSWDIPIYFGETDDYIIITSPPYVNQGVFTEESKQTIRPLWKALRTYIKNKEDPLVETMVEPGNGE